MGETAFMPKGSSRFVVALKGSSNVWSKEAKPNFHMTVVAAVNAAGAAIPPLIILPDQRIQKEELLAITIEDACEALQSKLHLSAETPLSKKDAISIACSAYRSAIMKRPENVWSDFKGTGLFPPSLVNIERRMGVYSNCGVKGELGKA
ncbi:hypothetical protein BBJ28_00015471 [Nothophytophthora sp. Chile5]|nr:hypothetical protein BBJ28_00015471 [Nothophytophthora sp. Chile5]